MTVTESGRTNVRSTARLLAGMLRAAVILAAVLVTALAGWTAYDLYRTRQNHRAHDRLALGMSSSQVREIMGRGPDCIVSVGRSTAWFFSDAWGIGQCPSSVPAPSSLPRGYDSLQVLVAPDGRVGAFALDGESGLTSAKGPARGQSLAELPPDHIE
jgi:hypothetical protein